MNNKQKKHFQSLLTPVQPERKVNPHFRSYSTSTVDNGPLPSPSPSRPIFQQQLSSLRPFSLRPTSPVYKTLDQVVHVYQQENSQRLYHKSTPSIEQSSFRLSPPSSFKKEASDLNQHFKLLLTRPGRAPKRKKVVQLSDEKRSKTEQEEREDAQSRVATQFIGSAKQDRKQLGGAVSRFQQLLQNAAQTYAEQNNVNMKSKAFKRSGLRSIFDKQKVCNEHKDQVHQFQKIFKKRPTKYDSNREDVYLYLQKNSKMVNMAKVEQQLKKKSEEDKFQQMLERVRRNRAQNSKLTDMLLYNDYFKGRKRKALVHASLHQLKQP